MLTLARKQGKRQATEEKHLQKKKKKGQQKNQTRMISTCLENATFCKESIKIMEKMQMFPDTFIQLPSKATVFADLSIRPQEQSISSPNLHLL